MKNKQKGLDALAAYKEAKDQRAKEEIQKQNDQIKKEQELNNILKTDNMKGNSMKLSKQVKSDLATIKTIVMCEAKEKNMAFDPSVFAERVQEYANEKAIELTTDHVALMNDVKSQDLVISFDAQEVNGALLTKFQKIDMNGIRTRTIPYDDEAFELQSLGEVEAVSEQTWDESTYEMTTKRVAMNFKLSRSLQFKSVVDQIGYVQSKLAKAVAKSMVNGIINGKSATSADAGIPSKDIRNHMAGIRATLIDKSLTKDFAKGVLDFDSMSAFLTAAGPKFRQRSSSYVLMAGTREVLALNNKTAGVGVTGVNADASPLFASSYRGIPLIEVAAPHMLNVTVSGSGYAETGLISSTAADNDHGILVLLNPKAVWYAFEAERVDVEYTPATDSFSITLNAFAGWTVVSTAKDPAGLMGVNIGADIA